MYLGEKKQSIGRWNCMSNQCTSSFQMFSIKTWRTEWETLSPKLWSGSDCFFQSEESTRSLLLMGRGWFDHELDDKTKQQNFPLNPGYIKYNYVPKSCTKDRGRQNVIQMMCDLNMWFKKLKVWKIWYYIVPCNSVQKEAMNADTCTEPFDRKVQLSISINHTHFLRKRKY